MCTHLTEKTTLTTLNVVELSSLYLSVRYANTLLSAGIINGGNGLLSATS